MTVVSPTSLSQAITAMADADSPVLLAGGTDLMVEVNEGRRAMQHGPTDVISLTRVAELTSFTIDTAGATLTLGSCVRWSEIERDPIRGLVPALAEAARTVGSPQIRHAGTIGGNLATCSPAGDGLPVLAALGATVQLESANGPRSLPVSEFMQGVKQTALEPGELIVSVTMPILQGWQGYSKVGVRNAMVIATASVCVATDRPTRSVRIALGSVATTAMRCPLAEELAEASIDWTAGSISGDAAADAGRLASEASRPIDDHRSTAEYRRHSVSVMVSRLLSRAFPEGGSAR